jgi:hypothetical protein
MSKVSDALELIRQLDLLLDGEHHEAITILGEQLWTIGGLDLLVTVEELVTFDDDQGRRAHKLDVCWEGICDDHESYVPSQEKFQF